MLQPAMRSTLISLAPASLLKYRYLKQIERSTSHDEPDLAVFPNFISSHWTTVDIGANIGRYTKHLSALSRRVIAIEPTPFTFGVLSNTACKLGWRNVELHNCALSDHDGTGSMKVPNIYEAELSEGNEIPVRTLDSLLGGASVDFIKCDVEKHEMQVIKGSLETIKRCKPSWLIEADWDAPIFDLMASLGYSCFVNDSGKLVPRGNLRSTNYWFTPSK